MSENCKNRKSLHCTRTTTQVLLYIHYCTRQGLTPYQRHFCCMIRTAVHIYCCARTRREGGVERRGRANIAMPAPLWHGSAYHCCCYFQFFVVVRYTLPCLWHSSRFFLLYSCRTIIVHVGSWLLDVFFLLRTVLYYCCTTYCCCTAVVRGGWVDRFVGVSTGSWDLFFAIPPPRYTGPALYTLLGEAIVIFYYCCAGSRIHQAYSCCTDDG